MIRDDLFNLRDGNYKPFVAKLIPNINPEKIIGIRTPVLRKYAKHIFGTSESKEFLCDLPHDYFEEDNLHTFLVEQIKDYDECISETEKILPYIDNWASCDSFNPRCFKKNTDKLIKNARKWLRSDFVYECRYGILTLMRYYLEEDTFKEEYFEWVLNVEAKDYYLKMMQAWYFATALAKQYDSTYAFISKQRLDVWTHNKAIQKAKESLRISREEKAELEFLKIDSKTGKSKQS